MHESLDEFEFRQDPTTDYRLDLQWEKCCEHSSAFIFDWIFFIVAGNRDMHIRLDGFEF